MAHNARHEATTTTTMICDTPTQKFNKCSMFLLFSPMQSGNRLEWISMAIGTEINKLMFSCPFDFCFRKKIINLLFPIGLLMMGKYFVTKQFWWRLIGAVSWVIFYEHPSLIGGYKLQTESSGRWCETRFLNVNKSAILWYQSDLNIFHWHHFFHEPNDLLRIFSEPLSQPFQVSNVNNNVKLGISSVKSNITMVIYI